MVLLIMGILLFTTSCSTPQEETIKVTEQPVITAEAEESGPLYVYGEQAVAQSELVLNLDDAPLLLNDSYIRLAGVVCGRRRIALVDVGGRGLILIEGDNWQDYRVGQVTRKALYLKKQEDKNEDKD